jgi:thioredoxin-like negative regulator of GroEL
MDLDEKNIDGFVKGGSSIVLFYADWCPFCRKFKPIFDAYSANTKLGIRMAEAKIDEEENPLWDRFGIEVIPTIVLFKEGKITGRVDGKAGRGLSEDDLKGLIGKAK